MDPFEFTKDLLRTQLQLGDRANGLMPDTRLMGNMPEFDSMAVVGLVASIEDQLGCEVDDEEITAEVFETVGSLAEFIASKME